MPIGSMQNMLCRHALAGMLVGAPLCALAQAATPHDDAERPESHLIASAKPAIDAANRDWLPAMQHRDARVLAEPYADAAVFVTRTGECIVGRAAIEQLYRKRFERGGRVVGGHLVHDGMSAEGDRVYEWGHARVDVQQPGAAPTTSDGRYLTVWARDAHGAWKILRNLVL